MFRRECFAVDGLRVRSWAALHSEHLLYNCKGLGRRVVCSGIRAPFIVYGSGSRGYGWGSKPRPLSVVVATGLLRLGFHDVWGCSVSVHGFCNLKNLKESNPELSSFGRTRSLKAEATPNCRRAPRQNPKPSHLHTLILKNPIP